jgi:hypothetical protein
MARLPFNFVGYSALSLLGNLEPWSSACVVGFRKGTDLCAGDHWNACLIACQDQYCDRELLNNGSNQYCDRELLNNGSKLAVQLHMDSVLGR